MYKHSATLLAAASLTLGACVDMPSVSHQTLGNADTLATKADSRLIYSRTVVTDPQSGKIRPSEVVCAEPSPDVAKAFSTAFGASAEAEANALPALTEAGDIKGSLALSRSRSEAIAQLGKRLGTIQLLRNGLFSACEAYANGAISPMSYAFLLSRFGDVMVTLLAVELVGGDGVSPDQTSTTASSDSRPADKVADAGAAPAEPASAPALAPAVNKNMVPATAKVAKQVTAVSKAGTTQSTDAKPNDTAANAKDGAATLHAETSGTSTPGQATRGTLSDAQSSDIVKLQQAFLRGSEAGPLVLACSVALERDSTASANSGVLPGSSTELSSVCGKFLERYGNMVIDTVTAERLAAAQLSAKDHVSSAQTQAPIQPAKQPRPATPATGAPRSFAVN